MKVVDMWLSVAISRESAKSNFKRKEDPLFFNSKIIIGIRIGLIWVLGTVLKRSRVKNPIYEGTMSLQEPFLHDNFPKNCFFVENVDTDVSKNRGTPKWMVYNWKPY